MLVFSFYVGHGGERRLIFERVYKRLWRSPKFVDVACLWLSVSWRSRNYDGWKEENELILN